jgi:hypothetical protein
MLSESLRNSIQRFQEVLLLAHRVEQQAQPDDLTRLKATRSAVAIAVKLEQLRKVLLRSLGEVPRPSLGRPPKKRRVPRGT